MSEGLQYQDPGHGGVTPGLPGSTTEIPDIFDVLEGGEDEGTVRFLLGFNGEDASVSLLGGVETFVGMDNVEKYVGEGINLNMTLPSPNTQEYLHPPVSSTEPVVRSPVIIRQAQSSAGKKRDTSGTKAIHNCNSCGKSFTTKFNLKRHINMHCHKSRENGIPIQGPPSASAPAKKTEPRLGLGKQYVPVTYQVTPGGVRGEEVVLSPEPDTTCRLPSVQTLLPVSTVYTMTRSCPGPVSAPPAPHNTDYGALPADLFEPDSSDKSSASPGWAETARPGPASPLIMLTSVPHGWTRKIEIENGYQSAKYCSPLGKKFSSFDEISQYFNSMNYSVPKHLFKFNIDPTDDTESEDEEDLVDSEEELDEEAEDCESVGPKRRRSENWSEAGLAVVGSVSLSPSSPPRHIQPTSTSPLA